MVPFKSTDVNEDTMKGAVRVNAPFPTPPQAGSVLGTTITYK